MTTVVPQHMRALDRANAIRIARAGVKRRVRMGEVTIADALERECTQTMTVAALLCCQHRWAGTRARQLLQRAAIGEAREVGQLTARQRRVLLEELSRA